MSLNLCSSGALSQAGKLGQIFRWNANLSWLPVTSTYLQSTAVISDSIEYSNWGEGEIFFVGIKIRFLLAGKGGRQKKRSFYGQADRKGGGLIVSKCENFGPIFPIIKW